MSCADYISSLKVGDTLEGTEYYTVEYVLPAMQFFVDGFYKKGYEPVNVVVVSYERSNGSKAYQVIGEPSMDSVTDALAAAFMRLDQILDQK